MTLFWFALALLGRDPHISFYFRELLQRRSEKGIDPATLPVVKYLRSLGANYRGCIAICDFCFDMRDTEFTEWIHPYSYRFVVGDLEDRTLTGHRTQAPYNHGNAVARVLHKIVPSARLLCVRLYSRENRSQIFIDPVQCVDVMYDLGIQIVVIPMEFFVYDWVTSFTRRGLELGMILIYSATNRRIPMESGTGISYMIDLNYHRYPGRVIWVGGDILPSTRHSNASYPTTAKMRPWFFSAPGYNVDTGIGLFTGASFSAPVVGGVVALLTCLFPEASPEELIETLRAISAAPPGVTAHGIWNYRPLESPTTDQPPTSRN